MRPGSSRKGDRILPGVQPPQGRASPRQRDHSGMPSAFSTAAGHLLQQRAVRGLGVGRAGDRRGRAARQKNSGRHRHRLLSHAVLPASSSLSLVSPLGQRSVTGAPNPLRSRGIGPHQVLSYRVIEHIVQEPANIAVAILVFTSLRAPPTVSVPVSGGCPGCA